MNEKNEMPTARKRVTGNGSGNVRTTIGVKKTTKQKLNENRAPGQCYEGFICQLVDLWEKTNGNK